jgi:predicted dehydrogenase
MHAVPHWQPFLRDYGRLTIANMSIHHYDSLRWLLGEPLEVFAAVTKDPRTAFEHVDGLVSSVIKFAGGTLAHSIEDVWVGPADLLTADDANIRWRVTGELGLVEGSCGWPGWPNEVPSTVRYLSQDTQGSWVQPRFATAWFPDAFGAVMCQLQSVLTTGGQLDNSGCDHLGTLAMVEAAYRSIDEARSVKIAEVW